VWWIATRSVCNANLVTYQQHAAAKQQTAMEQDREREREKKKIHGGGHPLALAGTGTPAGSRRRMGTPSA